MNTLDVVFLIIVPLMVGMVLGYYTVAILRGALSRLQKR